MSTPPVDPLDVALRRLVERRTLTAEQAEAVRAEFADADDERARIAAQDGGGHAAHDPADSERAGARRVPPLAEAAGYAGAALAVSAALAASVDLWAQLQPWAQLALLALAALVTWAGGVAVGRSTEPAARRLVAVLWLVSTAATAGAAFIAADDLLDLTSERTAFAVSAVTLVQALVLWCARPSALQHLAAHGAVLLVVVTGLGLPERAPYEWVGLAIWAVGVAWGLLTWGGLVRPVAMGAVLSALTALAGAQGLAFDDLRTLGLLLLLATVVACMAVGGASGRPALLGIGSVALAILVPQALNHWLPGALGGPAGVFLAGVVLIAGAIVTVRTARATEETA